MSASLRPLFVAAACLATTAALAKDPVPVSMDGVSVTTRLVAEGFKHPTQVAFAPGDTRMFVVEKAGRIKIVRDGQTLPTPFFDISSEVDTTDERGLNGIVFDPDFAANGRFYVDYATKTELHVAAMQVSSNPDVADPASETPILSIKHPDTWHYGSMVGFGPDGYLYVGTGDGGGFDDFHNNAQTTTVLLGKMLRLDVHGGTPYAIPPGNPFANGGGAPEVYFYGLRNPWRASFDGTLLYIGDVGQEREEEVDIAPLDHAGANFGWHIVEGAICSAGDGCDRTGKTDPDYVLSHGDGNCALIGGYVYRGKALPALAGRYFFGDYCTGVVRSFRYVNGKVTSIDKYPTTFDRNFQITSFGRDNDGEIYIVLDNGVIEEIVPAS
jgi:glucose/arabinose dehydrogenase